MGTYVEAEHCKYICLGKCYLTCIQVPTGTIEPPCTVKLLPSETVSIIHALNILYHSVDSFICLMLHYRQWMPCTVGTSACEVKLKTLGSSLNPQGRLLLPVTPSNLHVEGVQRHVLASPSLLLCLCKFTLGGHVDVTVLRASF